MSWTFQIEHITCKGWLIWKTCSMSQLDLLAFNLVILAYNVLCLIKCIPQLQSGRPPLCVPTESFVIRWQWGSFSTWPPNCYYLPANKALWDELKDLTRGMHSIRYMRHNGKVFCNLLQTNLSLPFHTKH